MGILVGSAESYKVVRMFMCGRSKRVIARGMTLAEAREHCNNSETSSSTATSAKARRYTKANGPWFDGYESEK